MVKVVSFVTSSAYLYTNDHCLAIWHERGFDLVIEPISNNINARICGVDKFILSPD